MKTIRTKTAGALHAKIDRESAFTRLELFACVVCVAFMGAVVWPVLATTRSQSDIAQCLNNLRRIGIAVQSWSTDHSYDPPWVTRVSDGGTWPDTGSKPANAWYEFSFLSNQLTTPRILACPADVPVKLAADFSADPARGYLATGFRANATSYAINLHTMSRQPTTLLCADSNLRFYVAGSCPYALNPVSLDATTPGVQLWTNAVHGAMGNIVLEDGSVSETTSAQLQLALTLSEINGVLHFMKAR
jgi:hypothetical protein